MINTHALSTVRSFGRWDRSGTARKVSVDHPVLADVQTLTSFLDVVGHIDLCGPDLVEGWVFWGSQPDQKLQLEVIIGGELLGRCDANLFRPDLQKAGYGDGRCAFSFHVAHVFTVRDFTSTRTRLVNSILYLLPDETTILWRAGARASATKLAAD